MDESCPNFHHHGQAHPDRLEFLRLVRAQLAVDRGPDADCMPLYLSGARGSLFKVRLSSHGYTLVAKGVVEGNFGYLSHENKLYDRLRPIQGKHVPVCLGRIDLVLPYYYNGGVYEHFLFLSWAGQPLFECDQLGRADLVDAVTVAFGELHKLGVLHRDAEPRNLLYNRHTRKLMVVDFERAEFHGRQLLGPISPNSRRKRNRGKKQGDDFARELQNIVGQVARRIGDTNAPESACHRVAPFGRNEKFVGREVILKQLLGRIPPSANKGDCQRTAAEGLGGAGKTQIALGAALRAHDEHADCSVL